eukprot:5001952-Pyramimonas_sp.AAC.1
MLDQNGKISMGETGSDGNGYRLTDLHPQRRGLGPTCRFTPPGWGCTSFPLGLKGYIPNRGWGWGWG